MKKLVSVIAILILLVSCSTDTLAWMYGLTSNAKENVLFHGDLEKLSSGVLAFAEAAPVSSNRNFSTVSIITREGTRGDIIASFSEDESAFLSALVISSANGKKCQAIQEKLSAPVSDPSLLAACENSMVFYNSLLGDMRSCLATVPSSDRANAVYKILSGFIIDGSDLEFTYREVVGFKVLGNILSAFLSYPKYAGMTFTAEELAREILYFEYDDSEDINTYIGSITGSLAEARNVVRTIGNGPVLSSSDISAVLDILLEEL